MLHDRREFVINATIENTTSRLRQLHEKPRLVAYRAAMRNAVHLNESDYGDVDFEIRRISARRFAIPLSTSRAYGKLQRLSEQQTLVTLNVDLATVWTASLFFVVFIIVLSLGALGVVALPLLLILVGGIFGGALYHLFQEHVRLQGQLKSIFGSDYQQQDDSNSYVNAL